MTNPTEPRFTRGAWALAAWLLLSACSSDSGSGGGAEIQFVASGEVLALTGYAFPPASPDDPAFVDGWDVRFTRLLVTVGKVTISDNPDSVPGDQSQTGAVVAEVVGPWAIDLAHSDPNNVPGKGDPGEEAVPFATVSNQNKNGNAAFATDGTRYAFGFDVVAATAGATQVNLDAPAQADYQQMVTDGCAVLYVGVATFKGDATCNPQAVNWPQTVNFNLCFKTPASYLNCQNPDNDPAEPFPNEEHQRGIALEAGRTAIAQVTMHTDHPFWDSVVHESPAHFDQFAARVAGSTDPATVTLEDTQGVDYTAYTDAAGTPVDWHYCVEPSTEAHAKFTGVMAFDPMSVPHATGTDPATGLRDYYDFATYNQSTQGHINSDGLCFVDRHYPSPQ